MWLVRSEPLVLYHNPEANCPRFSLTVLTTGCKVGLRPRQPPPALADFPDDLLLIDMGHLAVPHH